jgi:hypothetical protein
MRPWVVGLLTVTLLTGCSTYEPYVISTTPIGTVTRSTGFPSVMRNARPYILAQQSQLYQGDIVTTDEQSLVTLRLASGATVELGTRTQLLIKYFGQNGNRHLHELSLSRGSIHLSSPTVSNEFKLATTISAINTSTSALWLGYLPADRGVQVLSLGTDPVEVSNVNGAVTLTAEYEVTTITPGGAPQQPLTWSAQRYESVKRTTTRIMR